MYAERDECRVLIVQEDAVLAGDLQSELEKDGYTVRCVSMGRDARQQLSDASPDEQFGLVIAHVKLPDQTVCELMVQVDQEMPNGRPPFILTMGFGWDPAFVRRPWLNSLGARDSVLYVPFRRDDLRQALARAFAEKSEGGSESVS